MTGTFAHSTQWRIRPAPPRGTSTSTMPCRLMSTSAAARSVDSMMPMQPAGIPADSAASCSTCAMAAHDFAASEPPRSTHALPDFKQMPAASAVTFGRASYTTATTPSGTLTRVSWMPLSSVRCSCTRPSGSGSATSSSSAPAIASMRASSSIKRSSKLSCVPAARAASMSCALAASTSTRFARSAAAMAASALLRTSALVCASGAAAAFAASAMARTSCSSEAVMNFPPIRKPPAHRGG